MKRDMVSRLAIAGVLSTIVLGPVLAQQAVVPDHRAIIRVDGMASESFLPDKAVLIFGVVTERPRAADAGNENSKAVQAVIEAVKSEGIEPRAIQSTSVSLEPLFKQTQGGGQTITGFRASNRLQVEVSPPERAGFLAGKLIDKGVNTIDDISFASNANDERADRLRGLAMREARHRAEVYVGALGLKLGRVIGITPGSASDPRPEMPMAAARAMRAAPVAVPLEAGQQTDTERVSVTWEIAE